MFRIIYGQKGGSKWNPNIKNTYELVPHMTYSHWFHILTSRGKQPLEDLIC